MSSFTYNVMITGSHLRKRLNCHRVLIYFTFLLTSHFKLLLKEQKKTIFSCFIALIVI